MKFSAQSVEQIVRDYLSVQHRDEPEGGCPSAALLDEIGRSADSTKRAYTNGLLAVIDDIATRLTPDDPQAARVKTLSVFALMVGTLQVSRALADRQLVDEVLAQGIDKYARATWRTAAELTPPSLVVWRLANCSTGRGDVGCSVPVLCNQV